MLEDNKRRERIIVAKRRGKGEGSITRKGNGWQGYITIGYNPSNGNPIRDYVYGKTRKEVQDKLAEKINLRARGIFIEPNNITVKDWMLKWLEGREAILSYSSIRNYRGFINNHIIPSLGDIKLKKLRREQIQSMVNDKMKEKRNGKNLSPRTIKYILGTLSTSLEQARDDRIIYINEAKKVEVPKQIKKEMEVFTLDEMNLFLDKTVSSRHYCAYVLVLATGLRLGELLGLTWENVDFSKGKIKITKQVVTESGRVKIKKKLKTGGSERTIRVPEKVLKELRKQKKQISEEKLALGKSYQDNNLVFCTTVGKPYDPRNFSRYFKVNLKRSGIEKNIRFHDLRHTFATLSLELRVPPKTIQKILGHQSIKTTLDLYAHVTEEMEEYAVEKAGEIIS